MLLKGFYCKECGNHLEWDYENTTVNCPHCNKELTRKDVIHASTRQSRIEQLKAMHNLMLLANDEGIYMSWIYVMPDGATDEDFEDISIDDELYNECFDLFVKLIAYKGNRY